MVSLQFACLQRAFLEVYARSQWLEKWAPRLRDVDNTFQLDVHIMGAFTGDLDTAADLFRIGVPVWLVRHLEHQVMTKICKFVAPLDESWNHTLPLRESEPLDASHEDPPHPLIYTGLPGTDTRYRHMRTFVHQQFSSSLVGSFRTHEVIGPSSMVSSLHTVTSADKAPTTTKEIDLLDVTTREWVSAVPAPKKRKTGKFTKLLLCVVILMYIRHTSGPYA